MHTRTHNEKGTYARVNTSDTHTRAHTRSHTLTHAHTRSHTHRACTFSSARSTAPLSPASVVAESLWRNDPERPALESVPSEGPWPLEESTLPVRDRSRGGCGGGAKCTTTGSTCALVSLLRLCRCDEPRMMLLGSSGVVLLPTASAPRGSCVDIACTTTAHERHRFSRVWVPRR